MIQISVPWAIAIVFVLMTAVWCIRGAIEEDIRDTELASQKDKMEKEHAAALTEAVENAKRLGFDEGYSASTVDNGGKDHVQSS